MKLFALLAILAVAPLALAAPANAAEETVVATLVVDLVHPTLPDQRSCDVVVPAGSNVGDLLDAAVDQGCLSSWESSSFPGFGRYVTCIDGICEQVVTFWAFRVDGAFSNSGIDATPVLAGSSYQFTYEQWPAPLPL